MLGKIHQILAILAILQTLSHQNQCRRPNHRSTRIRITICGAVLGKVFAWLLHSSTID
jgi:hypothetical protein